MFLNQTLLLLILICGFILNQDCNYYKQAFDTLDYDRRTMKEIITNLNSSLYLSIEQINFLKEELKKSNSELNSLKLEVNKIQSIDSTLTRQWDLIHFDHFEDEKSLEGWSDKRTTTFMFNIFLGGHNNFSTNFVYKLFKNLPPHSFIKIKASYSMFLTWDGEAGWMKVDDQYAWFLRGNLQTNFSSCNGIYITALNV